MHLSRYAAISVLLLLLGISSLQAQILNPVHWSASVVKTGNGTAELVVKAAIDKGWHLYTQDPGEGPLPTAFVFKPSPDYQLVGKVLESKSIRKYEEAFGTEISFYENEATFRQKINVLNDKAFTITGTVDGMACNDSKCIPLDPFKLVFDVKDVLDKNVPVQKTNEIKNADQSTNINGCCDSVYRLLEEFRGQKLNKAAISTSPTINTNPNNSIAPTKPYIPPTIRNNYSIGEYFIKGFGGGLLALVTPCVYSMIPLTVSFFTKRSKDRKSGIRNALLYASFIVLIYIALGMLITTLFGGEALNEMASNIWINLFFFLIFILFAASFLGAFEITLPSSWINKIDRKSERGGIIGIFFMAFTLALVSFSCTGPIIGNLIVLVGKGNYFGPAIGMAGFAFALALPFALFAIFPGWLNSLPKSGGWLNSLKVVLGLLEIALAIKFLSNADLVGHWHLISREIFISIWVIVAFLTGFYLIGKLKFAHDSDLPFISVSRIFIAIVFFTIGAYLVPGIFGAPVKLIAGFPPPETNEWSENISFFKSKYVASGTQIESSSNHNNSCPLDLNCFHDYDEALVYAKKVGKPLFLDFTGWTCVNCREMEQNVWPDPTVLSLLRDKYVVVSLYVDEKEKLPKEKQYLSKRGTDVTTIGEKWKDLQIERYNQNAQPYYVLLDLQEKPLTKEVGIGYDVGQDIPSYINFLQNGLNEFERRNSQ